MMQRPALARSAVERAAVRRGDEAWLATAWQSAAVIVLGPERTVAVASEADRPRLEFVAGAQAPEGDRFFLGELDGRTYFAVSSASLPTEGARVAGLREVGALLDDRDAGLLVTAVALANWHASHPHCPRCGTPTVLAAGGWMRTCPVDGSEHYPRVDPAVIMLVHDGADRCLLGRQPSWPAGRFSTLAGFVEPGESAEQAVVREVAEETGVAVRDVHYEASQPWPFPSSLMLGFTARAVAADEPRLLDGELAEARWFTRTELAGRDAPGLPPPVSIAYRLITGWLGRPVVGRAG